jgi:cystathionine gamma-synthase
MAVRKESITKKKSGGPGLSTLCVHTGVAKDDAYNSVVTPIYATSTFRFEAPGRTKGYDYSRSGNPTRAALEESLAALEGGARASVTATGMAAVTTALHLLEGGAHVIAGHDIYGGTHRLFHSVLAQRGFSFSFVDMRSMQSIRAALRPDTRAIWIETPSNPLLNLVDIAAVCALARERGLLTFADNTFLSPVFQRPLDLGADVAIHSTTKYLNGHSDVVGGAIISRTAELGEKVAWLVNCMGTNGAPFDAWLVLRGIKTLPGRMRAHALNAMAIARFLEKHPAAARVYYPGLASHPQHALARRQMSGYGGMLAFDIRGGQAAAFRFIMRLKLFAFAESLGGVESLIEHPATMSHAAMSPAARATAGITGGTIRVSAGIEDAADLLADMAQALGSSRRR